LRVRSPSPAPQNNSFSLRVDYKRKRSPNGLRPIGTNIRDGFSSKLPRNRHPERSASRISLVNSVWARSRRTPTTLFLSMVFEPFYHPGPKHDSPFGSLCSLTRRAGLRAGKGTNGVGKVSSPGVLRLRARSVVSCDESARRFAQDDDFVGVLKKTPRRIALMGLSPYLIRPMKWSSLQRAGNSHRRSVCGGPVVPTRTRARSKTSRNMLRVSFPVFVFCREGWKLEIRVRSPGRAYSAP
jgi:hypothetical protein